MMDQLLRPHYPRQIYAGGAAVIVLAASVGVAASLVPVSLVVALIGLFSALTAAYRLPRLYLAILIAVLLLVPISAGIVVSADLPVLFVSRPLIACGLAGTLLRQMRSPSAITTLHWAMLVCLVALAASIPTSVDPRASLFKLASIAFESVGTWYVAWHACDSRSSRPLLVWTFALLSIVCALGIVEAITGFNLNSVLSTGYAPDMFYSSGLTRGGLLRIRSTFAHPVEYSAFLAMALPVAVALVLEPGSRTRRWLAGALTTLIAINLILALSLDGMLAAAISLSILVSRLRGRALGFAIALPVIVAGSILVASYFPTASRELLADRLDFSTATGGNVATRVAIVLAALATVAPRPLVGWGLNTWYIVQPAALFAGWSNSDGGAGNENLYAQVLVEAGLVGLSATVALLVFALRQQIAAARRSSGLPRALVTAMIAGTIGFYVANFTANVLLGSLQPTSMFWILGALIVRYPESHGAPNRSLA